MFLMWEFTRSLWRQTLRLKHTLSAPVIKSHLDLHSHHNEVLYSITIVNIGAVTIPSLAGQATTFTIKYLNRQLDVFSGDSSTPFLSVPDFNLADSVALTSQGAWIGFTASTKGPGENFEILNWSYQYRKFTCLLGQKINDFSVCLCVMTSCTRNQMCGFFSTQTNV